MSFGKGINVENNPYLSELFFSAWSDNFLFPGEFEFWSCFLNIPLVKRKFYYSTAGGTQTKGIAYGFKAHYANLLRGKTVLVYDVPEWLETEAPDDSQPIRLKRIRQYPGFSCNLKSFNTPDGYLKSFVSAKSRYKFRKYASDLEKCFRIRYGMHGQELNADEFEKIFGQFKKLLTKRFEAKQTRNNNLEDSEWELMRLMARAHLAAGTGGIFITYDAEKPIAMSFLLFYGKRVIDVMRVFDIDYAPFRIGSVSIYRQLEWCIGSNYETLDFSKGYFDYKKTWSSTHYYFEYHILYDSKSYKSALTANALTFYFKIKQWARERNFNELFHRLKYVLGTLLQKGQVKPRATWTEMESQLEVPANWETMNEKDPRATIIFPALIEILYKTKKSLNDGQLFMNSTIPSEYYFRLESRFYEIKTQGNQT